jgi:FeS assembly SUF system regulator
MLRLSKLTDYAVVVLVRLSRDAAVQTSPGISLSTGIPEPTVAKVLKAMTGRGLVTSLRGARGGYRLGRGLAAIAVSEVIEAIDGPIALTACVDGGDCDSSLCPMRGRWDPVNAAIREALTTITLADMENAAVPLAFRLSVPPAAPIEADPHIETASPCPADTAPCSLPIA